MLGCRRTRWIGVLAAAAVLAVPASPAVAAGWLSKGRAQAKTASVARSLYMKLDFATDYGVERASSCTRLGSSVVECDYSLYGEADGIVCDDAVRVRLTSYGRLTYTFPYKSDCQATGGAQRPTPPPSYTPPSYTPPSYTPPTTGNFGNGTGAVGYCNDGTLSDSIGRPGACSWHGGVAP
jgi:hypothetical protein